MFQELFVNGGLSIDLIRLFLTLASPEVVCKIEMDLVQGSYSVVTPHLPAIIVRSVKFPSVAQRYLWKMIVAEVKADRFEEICGAFKEIKNGDHWEAKSGLLSFINMYRLFPEHVACLLGLPADVYTEFVYSVALITRNAYVESGVLRSLQPGELGNTLRHLKYWKEQGSEIFNTPAVKNALVSVVTSQEFECLLSQ